MNRLGPLACCLLAACFYVTEKERRDRFDLDEDGIERPFDCNDDDAALGEIATHFADDDGDGFGDRQQPVPACGAIEGAVPNDEDCDDGDGGTFPGATEGCDGVDNNCDLRVDEELVRQRWFPDGDGDGFGDDDLATEDCKQPDDHTAVGGDCDDDDEDVNPDATELCTPGDEDCDGALEEEDASLQRPSWYDDGDADGFGRPGTGVESCEAPPDTVDNDLDCADSDADVNPDEDEHCNGAVPIDDNCDGITDTDAFDRLQFFADYDQDAYGDLNVGVDACEPPSGFVANAGDCDDGNAAINPDELDCTDTPGVDDNCNGVPDDGVGCL